MTVVGQKAFNVKDPKPSPVKVMDYYHTGKKLGKLFEVEHGVPEFLFLN